MEEMPVWYHYEFTTGSWNTCLSVLKNDYPDSNRCKFTQKWFLVYYELLAANVGQRLWL